jgi:hypothetical protein
VKIRTVAADDLETWPGCTKLAFAAPAGMEDSVEACEGLVHLAQAEVHVAWQPDEIDLVRLAHGGTIWLTCIGGLPPHLLEVRGGDR